jgi:DNA-binding NarL/FixJ family response regulator
VKTSSTNKQAVLSANEASHAAGQLKINPPAKTNLSARGLLDSGEVSHAARAVDELDSVFKQHPDLFRDPSRLPSDWADATQAESAHSVKVLLIRTQPTMPLIREYLLSDHRLFLCGLADRLGEACRRIRQHSYQVVVLSIADHVQDVVPLLDLMNTANPRAKAVAVLEDRAAAQLQRMIHPKVFGYVASHDAEKHLADVVMEVSQGRFTASPAISGLVMHLTSSYLTERAPATSMQPACTPTTESGAGGGAIGHLESTHSDFGSTQVHSSHMISSFLPSSQFSAFGEAAGFSARPKLSLAVLSDRERGILTLIAGGLSSSEIAAQLAISVPTVNTHIRNIFTKLGVHTRAQAIHVGISQGILDA